MKKKLIVLIMIVTAVFSAWAYDPINEAEEITRSTRAFDPMNQAEGINESFILVNTGFGYPIISFLNAIRYVRQGAGFSSTPIPSMSLSVDFNLPVPLPVSVGAFYGFVRYNSSAAHNLHEHGWYMGMGARFAWHFDFGIRNFDTYVGGVLGLIMQDQRIDDLLDRSRDFTDTNFDFFGGFHIGARYFFHDNIGMFAEIGFNQLTLAAIGLSLKF